MCNAAWSWSIFAISLDHLLLRGLSWSELNARFPCGPCDWFSLRFHVLCVTLSFSTHALDAILREKQTNKKIPPISLPATPPSPSHQFFVAHCPYGLFMVRGESSAHVFSREDNTMYVWCVEREGAVKACNNPPPPKKKNTANCCLMTSAAEACRNLTGHPHPEGEAGGAERNLVLQEFC